MEVRYGKRDIYHADELITIGDIHGEDLHLEDILNQTTPFLDNNPNCHIVFCGDYCNRGSNSARVFELLINLKKKYPSQAYFIKGNH
ncbi:MAG: metallophosphoesterase, partial [Porphyromonadaceae bacterium]|nr:metallophosphoesterase [Porphyromonadaceae bacterium]